MKCIEFLTVFEDFTSVYIMKLVIFRLDEVTFTDD